MQGLQITSEQKIKFIKNLLSTGGNVSRACQAAKVSRDAMYEHRKTDQDFAKLWDETIEIAVEDLEQEARRRAFKGYKKPVYQQGKLVGYVQEYSDSLLMFLLKGKKPEVYRERMDINQNVSGGLSLNIETEIESMYGDEKDAPKELNDANGND